MNSNIFRIVENFILNFTNFCVKNICSPKLLVSGILFTTSLIFEFEAFVVTYLVFFLSISLIFFLKFCLSVLYWFMWVQVVGWEIFISKLFTFFFSVLNFLLNVFLTTHYLLHHLIFSSLQEQFSICQHLNHQFFFF